MKKIFSLILCALIVFNMIGYYGIFLGLQYKNDKEMFLKLDSENYSYSETILIKVPFSMPYSPDAKDFHRVDGKFEHKGEFYRLVKQSLARDTLYIVCIKDNKEKKIVNFMANLLKFSTDLPYPSTNKKLLNSLIKDYEASITMVMLSLQGWCSTQTFAELRFKVSDIFFKTSIPPPKFFSGFAMFI